MRRMYTKEELTNTINLAGEEPIKVTEAFPTTKGATATFDIDLSKYKVKDGATIRGLTLKSTNGNITFPTFTLLDKGANTEAGVNVLAQHWGGEIHLASIQLLAADDLYIRLYDTGLSAADW